MQGLFNELRQGALRSAVILSVLSWQLPTPALAGMSW
jgi:hypothetical protein